MVHGPPAQLICAVEVERMLAVQLDAPLQSREQLESSHAIEHGSPGVHLCEQEPESGPHVHASPWQEIPTAPSPSRSAHPVIIPSATNSRSIIGRIVVRPGTRPGDELHMCRTLPRRALMGGQLCVPPRVVTDSR